MTIHVSATTGCNLGCSYCYEDPDRQRKQEWVDRQYDMDKIMNKLEDWKKKHPHEVPGMHGGEPLLVKKEDLETIFKWVDQNYDGPSHIQTNGTLLDEGHVRLFEEYNVSVGISCDGPPELNRERKAAGERGESSGRATDKMSDRTQEAIERIVESDEASVGVITVLHETNAGTDERLETLLDWMDWLNENGVRGHYNPAIPYEDVQEDISLSPERLKEVYLRTWEWMKEEGYRQWNPMANYVDNLLGLKLTNCVNRRCDVFNAGAAKIVKGDGETTGCGKTWGAVGDGVPFLQGDSANNKYNDTDERYEMLKNTPGGPDKDEGEPDLGGCKGCKYWTVCQGGCPSAGMNYDYRNRTLWCKAKYALYEQVENDIRTILPNVDLITDLPWDTDTEKLINHGQLDIKPFAAMDPSTDGDSSAMQGYNHSHGTIEDRVPEEALPEDKWRRAKEKWEREVDEEDLVIDEENYRIHADAAPEDEDENEWEKVE